MKQFHPALLPDERLDEINEHLSLIQKKDGLLFGTDAYLLAAFARAVPAGEMADLGSGSGVVSLLCLTKNKFQRAHAVELQADYGALIRRNAAMNGLSSRVCVYTQDVRTLDAKTIGGPCAAVLMNPPYLPRGAGIPHASVRMETARREENGTVADFCAAAARLLPSGGALYVVYRPDRLADLIAALREERLEPKRMVTVYPDAAAPPCLILVEARRDGAPSLRLAPPLCVFRSHIDRTYTDAMQRVYDACSMEFLFAAGKENRQ